MKLTEKVSYLKGLMSGLEVNESSKEGKVLVQMADILSEIADALEGIQDEMNEMTELVDIIDQDLGDVEDALLEDDDDCCCCDDDCDCDCDCDYCSDDLYEVTCPTCGDSICLDEDMLAEGGIDCPNCGENLEFDLDSLIDGCDCESDED